MARSHHKRKHKHFQPPAHPEKTKKRGGATSVMTVAGAIVGFAIAYFASQSNVIVIILGTIVGGLIGYWIGRNIDK